MKAQEIKFKNLNKNYSILIGNNILKILPNKIKSLCPQTKKIALIFDKGIPSKYKKSISKNLKKYELFSYNFKANEKAKSLPSATFLLNKLLSKNFNRSDLIISVGGGITGDLTGFVASIFKRGINLISIPTTLLAQVDSSVGGKTAINVKQGKNLIGSFYQPKAVITDVSFLSSLSEREIKCGLSEIIKYGVIGDRDFFNWLKENVDNLTKLNQDSLIYAIEKSCSMKANIVQKDEKEEGDRALLNFGHTFGHALEKHFTKNEVLLHGEAVAIGMVYASKFSSNIGILKKDECNEIINLISDIGLPISINDIKGEITKEEILNLMMFDKKRVNQKNTLILLNKIGEAFINNNVSDKEIIDFFNMENIQ